MTIYEKISGIQQELVAPKGQKNDFGNYNYRSCEDIEKALKPLLQKYKATVVMDGGEMKAIGERYYMTVKVIFVDLESEAQYMTSATVREEENKKGMDATQVSGACMSYARKYALAGLFLIDNEKDADTNEYTKKRTDAIEEEKHQGEVEFVQNAVISETKQKVLKQMCEADNIDMAKLFAMCKIKDLTEMTEKVFHNVNSHWNKVKETCGL